MEFSKPVAANPIRVESLSERIADALREDILFGRRRQGEAVTQQAIADQFGVSTMPVREALRTLSHEGIVVARANHTFRIARMTRKDVEDMYLIHGILAGTLAERACRNADATVISELEDLQDRFMEARKEGDTSAAERMNWLFHRTVNVAADAPRILTTLRAAVVQIPKRFYTIIDGALEQSVYDHPQLIAHFKQGRCEDAQELWSQHLRHAGTMIAKYLEEHGYWG